MANICSHGSSKFIDLFKLICVDMGCICVFACLGKKHLLTFIIKS